MEALVACDVSIETATGRVIVRSIALHVVSGAIQAPQIGDKSGRKGTNSWKDDCACAIGHAILIQTAPRCNPASCCADMMSSI
jgi:hypothetical protein